MSRGRRAGFAEGMGFPGHFLIRIGIDTARHVVDPFHDGAVREAADLRALVRKVLGPEVEAAAALFRSGRIATFCCDWRTTFGCALPRTPTGRGGAVARAHAGDRP